MKKLYFATPVERIKGQNKPVLAWEREARLNAKRFIYPCLHLPNPCLPLSPFATPVQRIWDQKLQCKQIENISTDSFKTSQTYYQKLHQNHQQSMNNRHWRPPGLSSGPLWAQKHPQRVPRDPQETLKIHQRGSKRVPRGSKRVPRGPQRVPNRPPNDPKMAPERAQEDLGNLKSENLLKH